MASPGPSPFRAPEHVKALLQDLHQQFLAQEAALQSPNGGYDQIRAARETDPPSALKLNAEVMRDKFIAFDADKALFVYHLLRALGATTVVEAGTSFGVSTIYLATAVGQNGLEAGKTPGEARVIATEHEPAKAEKAREHWQRAGETVEPWIELREGDILETLREDVGDVDFVLLDIWTPMVLPIVKLLEPRFKPGCVLVADNSIKSAKGYQEFFDYINAPRSSYTTLTIPYQDGLEMTVYRPNRRR